MSLIPSIKAETFEISGKIGFNACQNEAFPSRSGYPYILSQPKEKHSQLSTNHGKALEWQGLEKVEELGS